jgi:hypothetical protein
MRRNIQILDHWQSNMRRLHIWQFPEISGTGRIEVVIAIWDAPPGEVYPFTARVMNYVCPIHRFSDGIIDLLKNNL